MRAIVLVALLLPATVHADGLFELGGALSFPVGDNNWTNTVDSGPELGARVGAGGDDLAGFLAVAWTPLRTNAQGGSFPGGSTDITAHRFRVLGDVEFRHRIAPKLAISGRLGLGADILYGAYSVTFLGATTSNSDTNAGLAFDAGVAGWYELGEKTEIGVELVVPVGYHSKKAQNAGDLSFDYTQTNIDLWLTLRLGSRSPD